MLVEGIVRVLAADTVDTTANPGVFRGHSQDIYRRVVVVGDKRYFLKGVKARATPASA